MLLTQWTPPSSEMVWFDMSGIPGAVGIVAYCFVAHDTAFLYYNTLSNATTMRWSQTVLLSVGSAMVLSLVLSISAYFTFGAAVDGNVLNNYPVHDTSMIVTRCIYVVMMALTFPTAFFVVRHVVYAGYCRVVSLVQIKRFRARTQRIQSRLINDDRIRSASLHSQRMTVARDEVLEYAESLYRQEYNVKSAPLVHHLISSCILFFVPLALSMFVVDLGTAMSVIGSLSSVQLAFVMPCITHIKASEYGFGSFATERTLSGKWRAWTAIYPPFILAVFGVCLAVYGIVDVMRSSR